MRSIIITEKPDQIKKWRPHIGNRFGEFYPARGHLFELMPPEKFRPDRWSEWSVGLMREGEGFYPDVLKSGDPDIRRKYEAIRDAARHADKIYVATDPDREGEGIGWNILNAIRDEVGISGQVLRVLIESESKEGLMKAFEAAEPIERSEARYQSYRARANADHICNLSLTRSASKALLPAGERASVSCGRVLTPTFGMLAKRHLEISNFVPRDYFHPWVEVFAEPDKKARLTHNPAQAKRIFDEGEARQLTERASSYSGPIAVRRERKRQKPPHLFSLPKLQVEARRRLSWSVDKTTAVMQSIYEKQIVTYPRSQEVSLWETDIPNAPKMKKGILALGFLGNLSYADDEPVIRREKGAFSDKDLKGSAHYAIVPYVETVDRWGEIYAGLSDDERKLFELIARRYMAAISPERVYDATKLSIKVGDCEYATTGTVEVSPGWRETQGAGQVGEADEGDGDGADDAGRLPNFKDGETVAAVGNGVQTLRTKPPARFSDVTLIEQMIEAWREVSDPQLRAILKDTNGIGTTATQKDIVGNIVARGFAKLEGGNLYVTEAGLKLYDTLNIYAPKLLDVGLTGEMELMLNDIQSGRVTAVEAVNRICAITQEAIDGLVKAQKAGVVLDNLKPRGGKGGKPTLAMQNAAKAKAKREGKRVPPGVLSEFDKCRAYLGELTPRGDGAGPRPPSAPQLGFAQKIAAGAGVEIPADVLKSGKALSAWIDEHKDRAGLPSGPRPPSEPQLNFARKIASEKGLTIPADVLKSGKAISDWIGQHKSGGSRGGRSAPNPTKRGSKPTYRKKAG
jgi:DNA topoisomerase-3